MNAARARALRDALAARHAPAARATVVEPGEEAWLVAWTRRARCAGLSESLGIAFGCTGRAPPAVAVTVEPGDIARLVTATVELTASRARWHLYTLRLVARPAAADELAARGGLSFACRFSGAGIANSGRFALDVDIVPPVVDVVPEALDFGAMAAFGERGVEVAKGELLITGPAGERRIEVERAGKEWIILEGGLHHVRDGAHRVSELAAPVPERRVALRSGPGEPVDLRVTYVAPGLRVAPQRLYLEPGREDELLVGINPAVFDPTGPAAIELVARTPGDAGGGRQIRIRVACVPTSAIPILFVDPAPLRLGEVGVRNRKAVVRVPCRVAGPGTIRVDVAVEDAAGARIAGAARRLGAPEVRGPGQGVVSGEVEVELDLATLLARGPAPRRLVVTTDQPLRDRRVQEVPLDIDVTGRRLASRVLAVHAVVGLRYLVPVSFHTRGASVRGPLTVAVGLPGPLGGRLAGVTEDDATPAPWTRTRDIETVALVPGLALAIEPALALDLTGLALDHTLEGSWMVRLVDRATGLEAEVEFAVQLEPTSALVPRIDLELGAGAWTLAIHVRGAVERAFSVTEVAILGDPLPGFAPKLLPQHCAIEPGKEVVLRVAFEPPERRGGWLSRLMGKGEALAVRVGTDLPGGLLIARTIPLAAGREV